MLLSEFDFDLPEELIALRPAVPRDSARLLVSQPGQMIEDSVVSALPGFLRAGDVLIFNDTRTIAASLKATRAPRGPIGGPVQIDLNLHQRVDEASWKAFARPAKRVAIGDVLDLAQDLRAEVIDLGEGGEVTLRFSVAGDALAQAIGRVGAMPLPPYIARKRDIDDQDAEDYQTVYARAEGSVATPTAGLHFTPDLLAALDAAGIERHWVTLHVGAGTFLPVKVDKIEDHVMHSEYYEVSQQTAQAIARAKAEGRRVIAVGTTSLRTLETIGQSDGRIKAGSGDTAIFITPGYRFKVVDGLMTNFHLPKSTLLMLVGALIGMEGLRSVYRHAIESRYRFYSYGDASLLWKADPF
ncbi:S-adenosylmethionine:tRNA ribosyltransferase-isomerase [Candidatus Phycosocius bacilliformis]|uniref:S-adenosylmethionine:tRNA ribosyltransferase-isomerase n=1 Tax=Candidatus Phycosocius bacilliformis TaxID=1445552 RepID=A0A2P2E7P5_9PROT|nr:tRNA preQ1(34) S-adenosylmethionine ribosyltransferase-isomerase QueA [Candidatus Phycosocius bacilliformis]GBF57088.1 S-adenosylmethionine:tRNA ribosyltransferase-isomerase [Candidatus Phycosocius bacilliformis]